MNLIKKVIWAVFGNDEDGVYGPAEFYPNLPQWQRAVLWWVRNPMHNLTFHVLAVPTPFESTGKYPLDVFAPSGWNWAVRKHSWLRFPFVSYRGAVKFYIGWRERGNFGVKLTRNSQG